MANRTNHPRRYPREMALKLFRMVDGGIPLSRAANVLEMAWATASRLLGEEEVRQGRKAKRTKAMRPKATGGDMKGPKRARGEGVHGNREEILARLAVQLRLVTEEHSRRERA